MQSFFYGVKWSHISWGFRPAGSIVRSHCCRSISPFTFSFTVASADFRRDGFTKGGEKKKIWGDVITEEDGLDPLCVQCNIISCFSILFSFGPFLCLNSLMFVFCRVYMSGCFTDFNWIRWLQCSSCRGPHHNCCRSFGNLFCRLECQSSWSGSTICWLEALSCHFCSRSNTSSPYSNVT